MCVGNDLFNKEISGTTKIDVGLLFVIFACAYMFTSPFWGFLCGRYPVSRSLMFFGSFFAAFSYFFLGPSPSFRSIGLYYPCSFTSIGAAMAVLGLSLSAAIIPSCNEMVEVARSAGVEEQSKNRSLFHINNFFSLRLYRWFNKFAHFSWRVRRPNFRRFHARLCGRRLCSWMLVFRARMFACCVVM